MELRDVKLGMLVLVLGEITPSGDGELTPNNNGAIGVVEDISVLSSTSYPIVIKRHDAKFWTEDDGTTSDSKTRSFRPDEIVPLDSGIAALYGHDVKENET